LVFGRPKALSLRPGLVVPNGVKRDTVRIAVPESQRQAAEAPASPRENEAEQSDKRDDQVDGKGVSHRTSSPMALSSQSSA
jgi:hypothetical protein